MNENNCLLKAKKNKKKIKLLPIGSNKFVRQIMEVLAVLPTRKTGSLGMFRITNKKHCEGRTTISYHTHQRTALSANAPTSFTFLWYIPDNNARKKFFFIHFTSVSAR